MYPKDLMFNFCYGRGVADVSNIGVIHREHHVQEIRRGVAPIPCRFVNVLEDNKVFE